MALCRISSYLPACWGFLPGLRGYCYSATQSLGAVVLPCGRQSPLVLVHCRQPPTNKNICLLLWLIFQKGHIGRPKWKNKSEEFMSTSEKHKSCIICILFAACHNLISTEEGKLPNAFVEIRTMTPPATTWSKHAQTEIIEVSYKNPGKK